MRITFEKIKEYEMKHPNIEIEEETTELKKEANENEKEANNIKNATYAEKKTLKIASLILDDLLAEVKQEELQKELERKNKKSKEKSVEMKEVISNGTEGKRKSNIIYILLFVFIL